MIQNSYKSARPVALPLVFMFLLHLPPLFGSSIDCGWAHGFHARDLDDEVYALAVWDDGKGEALFVGGMFRRAEDIAADHVARWDGSHWLPLLGPGGGGIQTDRDTKVKAMLEWNGALYVAGEFATADGLTVNHIARWNGAEWAPLTGSSGTGTNGAVGALAVWDDGSGEALYVAGNFSRAGGLSAERIARWNGAEWSALAGGGLRGRVNTLEAFDDGGGEALYAAGDFEETAELGLEVNYIARWNGSEWSALEGPADIGLGSEAHDLDVWDGRLIAAGNFDDAGGIPAHYIAVWDGSAWAALSPDVIDSTIFSIRTWNDGSTESLYAVGRFDTINGEVFDGAARWDGTSWTALAGSSGEVGLDGTARALMPFDAGDGEALYMGGSIEKAGGEGVRHVARWSGGSLASLPASKALGMTDAIEGLTVWDDGSGEALYAVGRFRGAGMVTAQRVARWDGRGWAPLPGLGDVTAFSIAAWNGDLYIGGNFTDAAGMEMGNIARWDGNSWSPLTGASGTGVGGNVSAMEVWDDGSGEALYVGGTFATAGGIPAANIAKWDGGEWSALGSGTDDSVFDMTTWDDGAGEDLYVAGRFITAGGSMVNRIARWDGSGWSALNAVFGSGASDWVNALESWDGNLYLGGRFGRAGNVPSRSIARWDGNNFLPLLDGEINGVRGRVNVLHAFNDGTGEALYIGVSIMGSSGVSVGGLGKWDGASFTALGVPSSPVWALSSFAGSGAGPAALFAGGIFDVAGDSPSDHVAMRVCDIVPPLPPTTLESPSHEVQVVSSDPEIAIQWDGASDSGGAGLHGYSFLFDSAGTSKPDERIDRLHADGPHSVTSESLAAGRYYFHLKTCDRLRHCVTDHLGPFLIDDGSVIFWDGFESGNTAAWSLAKP